MQPFLKISNGFYKRLGRRAEFRVLRQQALEQVGLHLAEAKAKGQDALDFWMYLTGENANEALKAANLKGAGAIYQEILDELIALNDETVLGNIAVVYHQLGIVAQLQRRFDEATTYYQKALKIYEDAGDLYQAASDYHNLGVVAQLQRRFDEATTYYQKALKIYEDAGDLYQAANDYQGMGECAQLQEAFSDAADWFEKAAEARIAAKDWRRASVSLGKWAQTLEAQQQWTQAITLYIQVLAIDREHNEEWVGSCLRDLGRMLKQVGETQFASIWQEVTKQPWDGAIREAIQKASQTEE